MKQEDVARMALYTLPRLTVLVQARKQTAYQKHAAAGEHKHVWRLIEYHQDAAIRQLERVVSDTLELSGFRMKREIVE